MGQSYHATLRSKLGKDPFAVVAEADEEHLLKNDRQRDAAAAAACVLA